MIPIIPPILILFFFILLLAIIIFRYGIFRFVWGLFRLGVALLLASLLGAILFGIFYWLINHGFFTRIIDP